MLFTVIGPDGSIKASTDYIQCIYNNDTLVSIDADTNLSSMENEFASGCCWMS